MENLNIEALEMLLNTVNDASNTAIAAYTKWYFYNGIVMVIIGIVILFFSNSLKIDSVEQGSYEYTTTVIVKICMLILGFLIVACNIPDIIAPEGVATYKFIKSIIP